jgi:long-subunit acyl-CoA synthetase (AMP-forming)
MKAESYMSNPSHIQDGVKELSTRIIQTCNSHDNKTVTIALINELFLMVFQRIKEIKPNVSSENLQKIVDKRVVSSILEEFYFLDTAKPQIEYLRQIAVLDHQFNHALKFVRQKFLSTPVENRSELDENIQEYVQAILGDPNKI